MIRNLGSMLRHGIPMTMVLRNYLGRATGPKGHPIEIFRSRAFASLAEANWAVFRARWRQQTGQVLVLEDDEPDDPSAGESELVCGAATRPLLGYADRISVENGNRIEFKVSSELGGRYRAEIVRLRSGDHENIGLKQTALGTEAEGDYVGRFQPVHAGSYIEVPDPGAFALEAFTLQAHVWPTTPGRGVQALLGSWDNGGHSGYALVLDEDGALALLVGDGVTHQMVSTGVALLGQFYVDQTPATFPTP